MTPNEFGLTIVARVCLAVVALLLAGVVWIGIARLVRWIRRRWRGGKRT